MLSRLFRRPEPTAAALRRELARRVQRLQGQFDLNEVQRERLDAEAVRAYYRWSYAAYQRHHSAEGATHMAINPDGRFDPDGFAEHLRRIAARWSPRPPASVLELGFGQGYNLGWLAPRHPGIAFTGVDLTPVHHQLASQRLAAAGVSNVRLELTDFHQLPFADASFDEVFAIEAFCYARDDALALKEIARVLRPGGRFTLFDGYLPQPRTSLDAADGCVVDLIARGMALERAQHADSLVAEAARQGLRLEQQVWLDREVLPSFARLDRMMRHLLRFPWLARRFLAKRRTSRSRNVLSGYLMVPAMQLGLVGYAEIVLRKAD